MRFLRFGLSGGCLSMLLLLMAAGEPVYALSQGAGRLSSHTFQITLDELGYNEGTLHSPYGTTEYNLRLPEGWELHADSFFELDVSYAYNYTGISEARALPPLFGDIVVAVDREVQRVFPIREAVLEHSRLRVDLPPALLNDSDRSTHSIRVILEAGHICEITHVARLIIHPTSLFSLSYDQLPVAADLALYPRPFYQRAFEPDQVRFVLPARPAEVELAGAAAVAARLGDLTYNMVISGTTDLDLLNRLEALGADETLHEHLVVIGKPETNEVISRLNQLGVLPVPLQERQVSLASKGPAAVPPGGLLTYTLTLTNTAGRILHSPSLVDELPAYAQVVGCSPSCSEITGGQVIWSLPALEVGDVLSRTLELRLSELIADSMVENTVTVLDAASGPLNVSTLTTTVRSVPLPKSSPRLSVSGAGGYFFLWGERAVPENDGVVQELVSPWDRARSVLVITGLDDEAVYKACQAMSSKSHFPGMQGSFALVRDMHPLLEPPPRPLLAQQTFADLGYEDKVLEGFSQETQYYFDIPFGWRLSEGAALDLHFSHSQLLDYSRSFLTVLFNQKPIATIALSDENSLNGRRRIELPPSQAYPGRTNQISIHAEMRPYDKCADIDMWLLISNASLLHLAHEERDTRSLDLGLYPHPFDKRSDLADVLFVLPPEPWPEEWEVALRLAVALGNAADGPNLAPMVALGNTRPEAELMDYHIIVIGRPLRNPVLRQLNAQLPQPFRPGSDEIEQRIDDVVFRLPPGLNLGLVQLISSPWSEARAVLAVTGTTDEGVKQAVDVLVSRTWALDGNLALIRDDRISTVNTRGLTSSGIATAVSTAMAEQTLIVTATATATPGLSTPPPSVDDTERISDTPSRPAWLIPVVGMNSLIVLAILVFAIWRARRDG